MDSGGGYRVEAERWLTIAEKLLTARDLHGAKTFAIRARDSDLRLLDLAEQIIAVVDTLLAGELRINSASGNSYHDYYAILQLGRLTQSMELVATQYRKLALLLNPTRSRLTFSDHAFRLVSEAWMVFSNPAKKQLYDHELQVSQLEPFPSELGQRELEEQQQPDLAGPPGWRTARPQENAGHQTVGSDPVRSTRPLASSSSTQPAIRPHTGTTATTNTTQQKSAAPNASTPAANSQPTSAQATNQESQVPSFWTSCPYCYYLFEYPKLYEDCAVKCQKCRRAFQAFAIPKPPVSGDKDTYFCCWGYFPLGCSSRVTMATVDSVGKWSPFTGMFATPLQVDGKKSSGSKVMPKDDVFIDASDQGDDSSGDDWGRPTKKAKSVKGQGSGSGTAKKIPNERAKKGSKQNPADGNADGFQKEHAGKGVGTSGKKRAAKDLGKLDLNVMFNNEVEEGAPGASGRNRVRVGEEDNIEGISFFEGLDEFLSTLPILSVVGDDKVKAN